MRQIRILMISPRPSIKDNSSRVGCFILFYSKFHQGLDNFDEADMNIDDISSSYYRRIQ